MSKLITRPQVSDWLAAIRRLAVISALVVSAAFVPRIIQAEDLRQVGTVEELRREQIEIKQAGEVGLEIEARCPGASWAIPNQEGAALLISVDGAQKQDLLLYGGGQQFTYRVLLGHLEKGKHTVTLSLNPARSAPQTKKAEILAVRPLILPGGSAGHQGVSDDALALRYSPVLFARANSIDRFTDLPLLMYYEVGHGSSEETTIRYTVIFTNEDGGTPSVALMARWGRAADIEWVYEVHLKRGEIAREIYQGVEHESKPFTGQRTMGEHPLIAVASDNNNFSDLACSAVKYALFPVKADLAKATRESMMDAEPWTYRIMAEELKRERRLSLAPSNLATIADPRDYLYIEASNDEPGTAIAFEIKLRNRAESFRSDLHDTRLRIDRTGYSRSAIRLPHGTAGSDIEEVSVACYGATAPFSQQPCRKVNVTRTIMLDDTYSPSAVVLRTEAQKGAG
jgi:hypothetical protein